MGQVLSRLEALVRLLFGTALAPALAVVAVLVVALFAPDVFSEIGALTILALAKALLILLLFAMAIAAVYYLFIGQLRLVAFYFRGLLGTLGLLAAIVVAEVLVQGAAPHGIPRFTGFPLPTIDFAPRIGRMLRCPALPGTQLTASGMLLALAGVSVGIMLKFLADGRTLRKALLRGAAFLMLTGTLYLLYLSWGGSQWCYW